MDDHTQPNTEAPAPARANTAPGQASAPTGRPAAPARAGSEVLAQWQAAAGTYAGWNAESEFSRFNRAFLQQMLPPLAGLDALDAGCGDGSYTHWLAVQGARTTGCDGAAAMVRLARDAYPQLAFCQADLLGRLPFADASFDFVLCNQVLMDLPDMAPFATEAARVLRPGGQLLWSIVHPAFYPGPWQRDADGNIVGKLVQNYTDPAVLDNTAWGHTSHFHRPLGHYLNTLANAGLALRRLEEPGLPTVPRHSKVPLFLFALHQKASGPPHGA